MKKIKGFDGYFADRRGDIWSKKKSSINPSGDLYKLSSGKNKRGYCVVVLSKDGERFTRSVHRLILETFIGKRPINLQCRHLDGDPTNNHLNNIQWDTLAENIKDKYKHGRLFKKHKRIRIDLKLPENLLSDADLLCVEIESTRTGYIETLIRHDLKKRKKLTEPKEPHVYYKSIDELY